MNEDKSATVTPEERMHTAGILFIVTGVITFFLSMIGLLSFVPVLSLISKISLLVTIIVLGFALYSLTGKYPTVNQDAKRTRLLLLVFAVLELVAFIFVLVSVQILVAITGLASLLLRIVGFVYLDKTFRRLDDNLGSSILVVYAWYGVFVVLALIISVFSLNLNLILATSIISIIGEIALLIGVGIKIYVNAKEMTYIDPVQVPNRISPDGNYCTICGHRILETEMNYCSNCGERIN